MRTRRVLLVSWLLFSLMAGLWALVTPHFGSADEPAHVIKAVAVVRGHWLGVQRTGADPSPFLSVEIPRPYTVSGQSVECFAFKPTVSAGCQSPLPALPGVDSVVTSAGRYSPLYYLLVGGPSLVLTPNAALTAMRVLSGIWSGLFLAIAVTAAVALGYRWLAVAVSVAMTPVATFFAGMVNPSGLEITASVAVWVLGALLLAGQPAPQHRDRLWLALAGCLAVLLPLRALSPFWAGLSILCLLALGSRARVIALLRSRTSLVALPLALVSLLLAVIWTLTAHSLALIPVTGFEGISTMGAINLLVRRTPDLLTSLFGDLGWLDTPSSTFTSAAWFAAVGLLGLLAVAVGTVRLRSVLLLVAAAVVVLPIVISASSVAEIGPAWQGRYTLPLAVGVPLLSAFILDRSRALPADLERRLVVVLAWTLGLAEVSAVITALHRWSVGVDGPANFLTGWQPPLTVAGSLVLTAGVVLAFRRWTVVVFDEATRRRAALAEQGDPDLSPASRGRGPAGSRRATRPPQHRQSGRPRG